MSETTKDRFDIMESLQDEIGKIPLQEIPYADFTTPIGPGEREVATFDSRLVYLTAIHDQETMRLVALLRLCSPEDRVQLMLQHGVAKNRATTCKDLAMLDLYTRHPELTLPDVEILF